MRWPHWIDPSDPRLAPGRPPARYMVNGRKRRCPALRHHKGLGQAYVGYKLKGCRRVLYLGPWGSPTARARYNAFCHRWPAQLLEPDPPKGGKWPVARMLTHEGRTQRLTHWAAELGIRATTIRFRLDVKGWTVARALTTPVKKWTRRAA